MRKFKITKIFHLSNSLELLEIKTGKIYYYKPKKRLVDSISYGDTYIVK